MKKILILTIILLYTCFASAQDIIGSWKGVLKFDNIEINLAFHLEKDGEYYKGTMDSPDQGTLGIPLSSVVFLDNRDVIIEHKEINFKYEGKYLQDTIRGICRQNGFSFPLDLVRGKVEFLRPQEPKPPYPYPSEEVYFLNDEAGIRLAGTLTYPSQGTKFPAVVLVSGSGAQDRNEELMGHKPFLVIADYLTRNGIAVLRYDDRGFGESEGNFASGTTSDFATDAMAAVKYLKTRSEINPAKIGLLGHSEGGTICFINAAQSKDISFIITLAAPALSGDSIMMLQHREYIRTIGVDLEQWICDGESQLMKAHEIVKKAKDSTTLVNELHNFYKYSMPEGVSVDDNVIQNAVKALSTPWIRHFIKYNPKESIEKVTCPVFAINGEKDIQVNAAVNLKRIEKYLARNKNTTIKKYPNLNHLFQNCQKGTVDEYGQIEETISPEVLKDISGWILKTAK